jgi:hypothetical protein
VPNAPTTTASSVTSPNASVSSPSTVSSVTSPSSSSTPVSSVSSVTPPVSSVKPVGVTVKPQAFVLINGNCTWDADTSYEFEMTRKDTCEPDAKDLQDKADWLEKQINNSGGKTIQDVANLSYLHAKTLLKRLDLTCPGACLEKDSITNIIESRMYNNSLVTSRLL